MRATPRDLTGWRARFDLPDLPVSSATAHALEGLRLIEDHVDANSLGEVIARDPLMSLKVLAHMAMHRPARVVTDVETVTGAIVMMGITPFFRAFGPQPTVEQDLAGTPGALDGAMRALRRAHRAADFALAFAIHRLDPDAAIIHHAALLHDFPELLLWCRAPDAALRLTQGDDEQATLGIPLDAIRQDLITAWRLPHRLVHVDADRVTGNLDARSIRLAVDLAKCDRILTEDDVAEVADLLNVSPAAALQLLKDV